MVSKNNHNARNPAGEFSVKENCAYSFAEIQNIGINFEDPEKLNINALILYDARGFFK